MKVERLTSRTVFASGKTCLDGEIDDLLVQRKENKEQEIQDKIIAALKIYYTLQYNREKTLEKSPFFQTFQTKQCRLFQGKN